MTMSGRNNCCDLQQDTEADFKGFFYSLWNQQMVQNNDGFRQK